MYIIIQLFSLTVNNLLAPGVRIELTIAESKSVVLPLHYPGIRWCSRKESNLHLTISQTVASTNCATRTNLATREGFEPPTFGFGDQRSARLNYRAIIKLFWDAGFNPATSHFQGGPYGLADNTHRYIEFVSCCPSIIATIYPIILVRTA